MVRKLELESLSAEAATIDRLLTDRPEEADPIGYFQLSQRREELQTQINQMQGAPDNSASIALFFAGAPVVGSRGIRADFAGRAVSVFQDLVSKRFAAAELGELGRRGRIPLRANSDLFITDVVRGSFGVVLSETIETEPLADTQLKTVVDSVVNSIDVATASDSEPFEALLEDIDSRYLRSLEEFFELLDEEAATVRLVEGDLDRQFNSIQVKRGRERTSSTQINERDDELFEGTLFLLPAHRKFELVTNGAESIWGTVAREFSGTHLNELADANEVVGHRWRVRIATRTIQRPNQEPKTTMRLLGLVAKLD